MKNKKVKQMICDVLNKKHGLIFNYKLEYLFEGFNFERCYIAPEYNKLTKYGLHKASRLCKLGTVSLTEQQLRETK